MPMTDAQYDDLITAVDRAGKPYPWMDNACYEPPPIKPRRPYPNALLVLVMVSVAVGMLFILAAIP